MIRTDGRPTIAMRESEPLPRQMTLEECIALAEKDAPAECAELIEAAEPLHGGF